VEWSDGTQRCVFEHRIARLDARDLYDTAIAEREQHVDIAMSHPGGSPLPDRNRRPLEGQLIFDYHLDASHALAIEFVNRSTPQRVAIENVLRGAIGPLSAHEIREAASVWHENLGIATVYRHLKMLQSDQAVRLVVMPDGSSRYERADLGHHHHFLCSQCQRVFDVPAQEVRSERLPSGFRRDHDEVVIVGRCPSCPVVQPKRRTASL
jgi:Fur family ferric uptake transcriptional regulator